MKKLLLGLLAMGLIISANAQQGSILLFGNLGFYNNVDEAKNKTIVWTANPGVGYQFNEYWTVGLNIYWSQFSTSDSAGSSKMTTVNQGRFGAFVRYRKNFGNSPFYYYGHADVLYQQGYTTDADQPAFLKHSGMFIDAYPAIGMQVGCNWGINLSFGGISYMTDKYTTDATGTSISSPTTASTMAITFGQQVHVGASINLGCGKKMSKKGEKKEKTEKKSDDDDE